MTPVLHVQKVSGISGSEAHLLSVLPLLRARGWDARMLVLDEGDAAMVDGSMAVVHEECAPAVTLDLPNLVDDVDTLDDLRRLGSRLGRQTRAAASIAA